MIPGVLRWNLIGNEDNINFSWGWCLAVLSYLWLSKISFVLNSVLCVALERCRIYQSKVQTKCINLLTKYLSPGVKLESKYIWFQIPMVCFFYLTWRKMLQNTILKINTLQRHWGLLSYEVAILTPQKVVLCIQSATSVFNRCFFSTFTEAHHQWGYICLQKASCLMFLYFCSESGFRLSPQEFEF